MSAHQCTHSRLYTVATGAMFIVSGAVVWAGARGWYSVHDAWAWWPLAFVFPAVHALTTPPPERSVVSGLSWLSLAAVLIAMNLGYVQLRVRDLMPLILVALGLRLLYRGGRIGRSRS